MITVSMLANTVLTVVIQVWYLIPLVLVILFFKSRFGKGLIGEMLVNFAANVRLDKNKYHLLKNVTLPTEDGTTQIDHVQEREDHLSR